MSNTTPKTAAVESTITTVLDDVAPFIPRLAQRIPTKVRIAAYPLGGAALTIFNSEAGLMHVSDLAVWIVDAVATVALSALTVGNIDVSKS